MNRTKIAKIIMAMWIAIQIVFVFLPTVRLSKVVRYDDSITEDVFSSFETMNNFRNEAYRHRGEYYVGSEEQELQTTGFFLFEILIINGAVGLAAGCLLEGKKAVACLVDSCLSFGLLAPLSIYFNSTLLALSGINDYGMYFSYVYGFTGNGVVLLFGSIAMLCYGLVAVFSSDRDSYSAPTYSGGRTSESLEVPTYRSYEPSEPAGSRIMGDLSGTSARSESSASSSSPASESTPVVSAGDVYGQNIYKK